jgi:DNA-binding NarL/FixJ family response regulator
MTICVGIVDDHRMFSDALRLLLEAANDIEVAYIVDSGREALEAAASCHADVVVLDIDLPDGNGLALAGEILERSPGSKVVITTALSDPGLIGRAIAAGADGYISKRCAADELVDTIRGVAAGRVVIDDHGTVTFRPRGAAEVPLDGSTLTVREVDVLQGLADGLSTDELATALFLSPRTVQGYVQSILTKLHTRSKLEAVLRGLRLGIVTLRPPQTAAAP